MFLPPQLTNSLRKNCTSNGFEKRYQGSEDLILKMRTDVGVAFVKPNELETYVQAFEAVLPSEEMVVL